MPCCTYIISDFTYFIDNVITKGVLFLLKELNESVFSKYGDCFEDYIGAVLKTKHKDSVKLKHKLYPQNRENNLEIDALVESGNVKIIYEIKSVLINESEDYINEINIKYGKAVQQLADRIKFFASSTNTTKIYPILIVEDEHIVRCQFWLQENLNEQLDCKSYCKKIVIYPLIIISVKILELLPDNINLLDIFKEYLDIQREKNIGSNFYDYILSRYKHGTWTSPQACELITTLFSQAKEKMF